MRLVSIVRGMVRAFIVLGAGIALVSAAVWFGRTAASKATASPPQPPPRPEASEELVCFGTVTIEHGVTSLYSLQPGRVSEVLVSENQAVAQGAELVRLDDSAAQKKLTEAEVGVELAQLQLREARKQPQLQKIRKEQQQAMCDAMASRVATAKLVRDREAKMAQPGVASQSDPAINEQRIREMEALERAEGKRLAEIEAQDVQGEIQRAEVELKAAETRRDQARLAIEECRLKAPGPGTVLRVLVGPGDIVGAAPGVQPTVLFAADGPQIVRATVEQEFAGRVKEGALALVFDESDRTLSWCGRVSRVAGWYAERRTVLHDPSQFSDVRTLECVIALDQQPEPRLRLGQSVRVVIGRVQ